MRWAEVISEIKISIPITASRFNPKPFVDPQDVEIKQTKIAMDQAAKRMKLARARKMRAGLNKLQADIAGVGAPHTEKPVLP